MDLFDWFFPQQSVASHLRRLVEQQVRSIKTAAAPNTRNFLSNLEKKHGGRAVDRAEVVKLIHSRMNQMEEKHWG